MGILLCLLSAFSIVENPSDLTIIYFGAKSCPACVRMRPLVEQLHADGWTVRTVDTDNEPATVARWQVRVIPALVILKAGREIDRIVGGVGREELLKRLGSGKRIADESVIVANDTYVKRPTAAAPNPNSLLGPNHPLFRNRSSPASKQIASGSGASVEDLSSTIGPNHPFYARYQQRKSSPPEGLAELRTSGVRLPTAVHPLLNRVVKLPELPQCMAATVRLRVNYGDGESVGTGTIIETSGDQALVLTCGHLFQKSNKLQPVNVELYLNGKLIQVAASVIDYRIDEVDLGLVRFRYAEGVTKVPLLPKGEQVHELDAVFSIGCDRGAGPSRRDTLIAKLNRFLGPPNIEIAGAPVQGRSGGGLFDAQGRLIGVCFAADNDLDEGLYVGPESIYALLAKHHMQRLFETEQLSRN